eukprot:6418807-Amphidinium_carterae.1
MGDGVSNGQLPHCGLESGALRHGITQLVYASVVGSLKCFLLLSVELGPGLSSIEQSCKDEALAYLNPGAKADVTLPPSSILFNSCILAFMMPTLLLSSGSKLPCFWCMIPTWQYRLGARTSRPLGVTRCGTHSLLSSFEKVKCSRKLFEPLPLKLNKHSVLPATKLRSNPASPHDCPNKSTACPTLCTSSSHELLSIKKHVSSMKVGFALMHSSSPSVWASDSNLLSTNPCCSSKSHGEAGSPCLIPLTVSSICPCSLYPSHVEARIYAVCLYSSCVLVIGKCMACTYISSSELQSEQLGPIFHQSNSHLYMRSRSVSQIS